MPKSPKNQVKMELGITRCGLACCLCHENITCNGCNPDECKDKEWCENLTCKGIEFSYQYILKITKK